MPPTIQLFFLPLSILQHDDQYPHKNCYKVHKEVQGMLDVIRVTIFSLLHNDLQHTLVSNLSG